MMNRTCTRALAGVVLLAAMAYGQAARAQALPPGPSETPRVAVQLEPTVNSTIKCVQPPPLFELRDYNGPLKKTVGVFAGQLDLRAVRVPNYRPGQVLCSLKLKDKFFLSVRDTFSPGTFVAAGFISGFGQAINQDASFGQGWAGYGKRFGTDFLDQASFKFFNDFAYPSIFREDPRYYRLIDGSRKQRLLHAINHAFVARSDNNRPMFNFSEWVGTATVLSLSNLYHPGNQRGFGPTAEMLSYNILEDMGFDIVREFWPDIAHKFRLPLSPEPAAAGSESNPN